MRKEPKDVDAWLEMAALWLERGGAEGDEHALNALSHGLDVNNDSLQLWLAYLDLFDDSAPLPDVSEMAGHAVRLIPADVRLCIMQAQSQVSVDAALMCLERLECVEVVEGRECSTESLIRDDAYLRVRGDLTLCAANVLCLAGRPGEAADRIRSKIAEMSDEPELWAWMVRVTAFESIGVEAGAMLGFGACRLLWSHQAWTRCDANSQCNGHNMAGRDPRGGRGGWDGAWAWKEASGEGGDVALAFEAAFFGLASSSVKERAGHIAARLRGEYVAWAACRAASAKWRIGAAVASGLAAVWPKELQQCCQRELEKLVLFLKPMTWGGEIFKDKGVGGALTKAIQSLSPQIMTVGNLELANACAWIQLHAGDESGALSSLGWGAMYESVDTAPEAEDGDAWRCNKILHSYLTGGLSKLEDEVDLIFPIDTDGCTQGLLGLCAQVFRILACFPKDVSTERIGAKLFRKMFCEDSDVRLRSKDRSRGTDRLRGTAPEAMVLQFKFNEVFFNVIDQASAEMKMIAMNAWAAGHHASNMCVHVPLICARANMCVHACAYTASCVGPFGPGAALKAGCLNPKPSSQSPGSLGSRPSKPQTLNPQAGAALKAVNTVNVLFLLVAFGRIDRCLMCDFLLAQAFRAVVCAGDVYGPRCGWRRGADRQGTCVHARCEACQAMGDAEGYVLLEDSDAH